MTAKKLVHNPPPPTELVIRRESFKDTIQGRIEEGKDIFNKGIRNQIDFDDNKKMYYKWDDYNSEYLKQSFNNEHNEYKTSYDSCANWVGFIGIRNPSSPEKLISDHKEIIKIKIENLEKLHAKIDLLKSNVDKIKESPQNEGLSKRIFIVHGHGDRMKIEIARTLERIDLEPIILSEQANEGLTIIEKFERHSHVSFAIILLTADDLGRVKTSQEDKFRGRQNVILEMGYFIGKLGRPKVFILYEAEVELPSDLHGIVYTLIDDSGGWKMDLARELIASGYAVDANKLL